jgi:hypothetical protein
MLKQFKFAAIALGALILCSGSANATYVPAGTLSISPLFNPTVSLTANTVTLPSVGGSPYNYFYFGGTGQFTSGTGYTSSAILNFSSTVFGVVGYSGGSSINNLFTFTDSTTGETYDFNLDQSITTLNDSTTGSGTSISLYVLGDLTATGTTVYNTNTPTALTLSLTQTGGSAWSLSGTLANPPPGTGVPVPEPTSIALLGGGLAALGFVRRRQRKQ